MDKLSTKSNEIKSLKGPVIGVGIVVSVTWHRSISNRPRDGKACGCGACFGLCDIGGIANASNANSLIFINENENVATIYYIKDLKENPDYEGDSSLILDNDIIVNFGENLFNGDIKFLAGEYIFNNEENIVSLNNVEYHTYGYSTINITIN
jgi:hypothetical protein